MKITDKVKTYEDACQIKGITPLTIEDFKALPEDQRDAVFAVHKLFTIAEALNEGVVFDWDNIYQRKCYPSFKRVKAFHFGLVDWGNSYSSIGNRLTYAKPELAEYAGIQFLDIYEAFMK